MAKWGIMERTSKKPCKIAADLLPFEYCRNSNRGTLVTRNTRHFKQIRGVRVVN